MELFTNYQKLLTKDSITALDDKLSFTVTVLDTIFYIRKCWSMIFTKTIANCLRHAGFDMD